MQSHNRIFHQLTNLKWRASPVSLQPITTRQCSHPSMFKPVNVQTHQLNVNTNHPENVHTNLHVSSRQCSHHPHTLCTGTDSAALLSSGPSPSA